MSPATLNRRTMIRAAIALAAVLVLIGGIVAITMNSGSSSPAASAAHPTGAPSAGGSASTGAAGAEVDLACGKATTATSGAGTANPPSNATACPASTGWLSTPGTTPQSIQVDLGSAVAVDHLTVVWGTSYATKFKVRTATNGADWHTINSVSDGKGGTQTVALPAGTNTEWIQLYLEQADSGTAFGIDQLQVFGPDGSSSSTAGSTPTAGAASGAPAVPPVAGSSTALWTGQFTGYGTKAWKAAWGYTDTGQFGQTQLSEVSDPTAPGDGSALRVLYGAGSSANSCKDCPSVGGGQFYQQLSSLGSVGTTMENSTTLDLKYSIKLPAGWDFGEAGKLPGLYGGQIGEESGGNHGADGWSTRYMFRAHAGSPNAGEVYLYTPTNSGPTGYGVDYFGTWNWTADGNWHTVEQLVNRQTGSVTVWFDGKQVMNEQNIATGISAIPFSGVFFSTFFGGHDTSWGPKVAEYSYFADFSLSTGIQH